jgi:acetolactate synthase-1/2/3 large subunit
LIHVGLGAANAQSELVELAERLGAVVSSTFSGKGVFPETHPQWLWAGFGRSCPKPLQRIVKSCDSALIIGARLGEVSTGSYGITLPKRAIHVDIDAAVIGANFPVQLGIQADARDFAQALLASLEDLAYSDRAPLRKQLQRAHTKVEASIQRSLSKHRVSPSSLFAKLQELFPANTCFATDSGKGTFLAVEHLRLTRPGRFMAPTDYSCMGYSVPAAIGAAFADPTRPVVALPGDGALLMTGLEILTAVQHSLPVAVFVLNDGELGQISQFQRRITKTTPCTSLTPYSLSAFADMFGIPYLRIDCDVELEPVIRQALKYLADGPVVVDVRIDYSRLTDFTRGVLETNLRRLPLRDRVRFISRVVTRTLI